LLTLPPVTLSPRFIACARPLFEILRAYHHYEIRHLEYVPKNGPALIVFTHSLATYDILLFGSMLYLKRGRLINALADRLVFKTPVLRDLARQVGAVVGEPHIAHALIEASRIVAVAPGGMREALRPSSEHYRLSWDRRFGFVKLALQTRVPVILAACPRADDIYTVYENSITHWIYEYLRVPVPIASGAYCTPLPKHVHLVHHLAPPLVPPPIAGTTPTQKEITDFFAVVKTAMETLIADALNDCVA